MADLGEVPFGRYYGSVDSTPLFVMLAGQYLERTGDVETIAQALAADHRGGARLDRDATAIATATASSNTRRRTGQGLANQGWKDSHDAIFHADGRLAQGPIALVEVQAYVYAAWRAAERKSHRGWAIPSARPSAGTKAEAMRSRFDSQFFDPALGTYVLALDGDKKPCRVRASNAGHALFAGVAYPERAASVVRTLMGSAMLLRMGNPHRRLNAKRATIR